MDINIDPLKALSKPACKLIEAVRAATGVVYEPTQIRRRAKAEGEEKTILATADARATEIAYRAAARLGHVEVRRQENIESIIGKAIDYVPAEASDEPVDQDWIHQFFEQCQDVSNERMQALWARLLAGEVTLPGSFSPRTMNVVRFLRVEDAALFTKCCRFIWDDGYSYAHLRTPKTDELLNDSVGLRYVDFLALETLGLIQVGVSMGLMVTSDFRFTYYGHVHKLSVTQGQKRVLSYPLTDTGTELARIAITEPHEEYRSLLVARWRAQGMTVEEEV